MFGLFRITSFFFVLQCIFIFYYYNDAFSEVIYKDSTKDVVVGFLSTQHETFDGEYNNPKLITKVLEDFGAKVVLIDYNKIVNFSSIGDFSALNYYDVMTRIPSIADEIYSKVERFVIENGINRILIPGNYYNISSKPFPPTPYRQLITDALVRVVEYNPSINILAICGGLQGVMVTKGIKISRVEEIVDISKSVEDHHVSALPHPKDINANLHKVIVERNSRLASIIRNNGDNNSFVLYFPDYHYEAIDMKKNNMTKLINAGYKVVAYSEDGIIEALEDGRGNIYFQNHPEYLAVEYLSKCNSNDSRINLSINVAIAILKDFLYRK